jgi:hypothetical protein
VFVVNYDVPSGTVLDSFSLFGPNALAVLNFTITSTQPVQSYFAVQPSGPNSGEDSGFVFGCDKHIVVVERKGS